MGSMTLWCIVLLISVFWSLFRGCSGAFSEVKSARHRKTGQRFAIKIIDKSKCKGKENMIETEVHILKRVQHESIITLYDMFEIENKIYLVMELYVFTFSSDFWWFF